MHNLRFKFYLILIFSLFVSGRFSTTAFSYQDISADPLKEWTSQVVENDNAFFPRQKVIAEMFTASWCGPCYYANQYIDQELIPQFSADSILSVINYHVYDINMTNPQTRLSFYQVVGVPTLFLNGAVELYPNYLDESMIRNAANDSSHFFLKLEGNPPDADGKARMKVTVSAGSLVESLEYNFFLVLTESGIDPTKWVPPHYPSNGETIYNHSMRLMVTGESGTPFTIQPGEALIFNDSFTVMPTWVTDSCEIVAFIQHLETRQILQAESQSLSELTVEGNLPPTVLKKSDNDIYTVNEGKVLAIGFTATDPDPGDLVTVSVHYSLDGIVYGTQLPPNVTLLDSVFFFEPDYEQSGLYYFLIIGTDQLGLSDTVEFRVNVLENSSSTKSCDFNSDGKITVSDVIAFLLIARSNPLDIRLDWNEDKIYSIADAIALLVDIINGKCPDVSVCLSAIPRGEEVEKIEGLTREDIVYLERVLAQMDLNPVQDALLRMALYGESGTLEPPGVFSFGQNSPNPFNPSTTMSYTVTGERAVPVTLKVYDLRGRLVRTLVDDLQEPGIHNVFWDGTDGKGRHLPSGIFLCRMQSGKCVRTRKIVLLK